MEKSSETAHEASLLLRRVQTAAMASQHTLLNAVTELEREKSSLIAEVSGDKGEHCSIFFQSLLNHFCLSLAIAKIG